jgi:hypothetical protein
MDTDLEQRAIVRALASYLRTHALACDGVDGIWRWWFPVDADVNREKLMNALTWMTQAGLLEQLVAADGHVRYRSRADDAQLAGLLQDPGEQPLS